MAREPLSNKVDLPPTRPIIVPVAREACGDAFSTGPLWDQIDQERARGESEWIAAFLTSKIQPWFESQVEPDYTLEMERLVTTLDALDIEILQNRGRDSVLVVAGTPEAILEATRTSCSIVGFELSGFHCDCAPEQCRAARTCHLWPTAQTLRPLRELENYSGWELVEWYLESVEYDLYTEFSIPIIACRDDVHLGVSYAAGAAIDPRRRSLEHVFSGRVCSLVERPSV